MHIEEAMYFVAVRYTLAEEPGTNFLIIIWSVYFFSKFEIHEKTRQNAFIVQNFKRETLLSYFVRHCVCVCVIKENFALYTLNTVHIAGRPRTPGRQNQILYCTQSSFFLHCMACLFPLLFLTSHMLLFYANVHIEHL